LNSACIIAACAANARQNRELVQQKHHCSLTNLPEVLYKIRLRMYIDFESIRLTVAVEDVCSAFFKSISIPSKSIAIEDLFTIGASKCPAGPDKYMEENLDIITSSIFWQRTKEEIIDKYLADIKNKHNIIVDKSYINYNIRYSWEIDVE